MFLEYQISTLEWSMKDQVILKTQINGCNKYSFAITGINYVLKYINIGKLFNCNNISQ